MLFLSLFSVDRKRLLIAIQRSYSWNVMFFGNDKFSLQSLKHIHKHVGEKMLVNHLEVVVNSLSKRNPIFTYAADHKIEVQSWPPALTRSFDFGVVVSFGKLIPKTIIDYFPLGIINVHASLLPQYRGGAPIIHAIKNGDTETGISIMQIKPDKFDIGDILMQKSCSIGPDELMPSLHTRLADMGAECIIETIASMPDCLNRSKPQSRENISYAPLIKKDTAIVKWSDMTAFQVYNLYRAIYGMYTLTTEWHGSPIKLLQLKLSALDDCCSPEMQPGQIDYSKTDKILRVRCKDTVIRVTSLRNKQQVNSASAFYKGYLLKRPKTEWIFS